MRYTPEQAMAKWIKAGASLSVDWFTPENEFGAALYMDGDIVADGNGRTVEEAIENCAANIEDLPQAQVTA